MSTTPITPTMDCSHVTPLLSAFADGEIDATAARGMEAHLEGCSPCRDRLSEIRWLAASLGALPQPSVPGDFLVRVRARIDADRKTQASLLERLLSLMTMWRLEAVGGLALGAMALYLVGTAQLPLPGGGDAVLSETEVMKTMPPPAARSNRLPEQAQVSRTASSNFTSSRDKKSPRAKAAPESNRRRTQADRPGTPPAAAAPPSREKAELGRSAGGLGGQAGRAPRRAMSRLARVLDKTSSSLGASSALGLHAAGEPATDLHVGTRSGTPYILTSTKSWSSEVAPRKDASSSDRRSRAFPARDAFLEHAAPSAAPPLARPMIAQEEDAASEAFPGAPYSAEEEALQGLWEQTGPAKPKRQQREARDGLAAGPLTRRDLEAYFPGQVRASIDEEESAQPSARVLLRLASPRAFLGSLRSSPPESAQLVDLGLTSEGNLHMAWIVDGGRQGLEHFAGELGLRPGASLEGLLHHSIKDDGRSLHVLVEARLP